jgi:acyl-[acyl-carrier-protein]-phospholipid O-acyltransferase/long-chain-fatty-acid--[acyl-carrier-protein] ligase
VFSVGIGVGSMLCGRLLGGTISARHVPLAALGLSLFAFDLYFAAGAFDGGTGELAAIDTFIRNPASWRVLFDLLMISVCGGLYIVPLYAIMQARSEETERARTIAANNVLNALFMVASAIVTAAMLAAGFTVDEVFLSVAAANLAVAAWICRLLPDALVKTVVAWALRRAYGVRVSGLENLARAGERAVIVVNHVSFLDPVLMAAFLPNRPIFAINTQVAGQWWVRPFLKMVDAIAIDPARALSTRELVHAVRDNRMCVIFPEGRISVTGALMKIYEGPGLIADHAAAPIVPVRIDGPQYTPFSRLQGRVRRRLFPRIAITVLPPRRFELPADLKGRARRRRIGNELYDVMSGMMFETADRERTLFEALLDSGRIFGAGAPAIEDIARRPMGYGRMVAAALALGRPFARLTRRGEAVGIMLPNAAGTAVAFFALQAYGRVPAMLNFTTGTAALRAACALGRVGTIVTARQFIEQARLGPVAEELAADIRLVYLEDIVERLGMAGRLFGALARPFARRLHRRIGGRPHDPGVILFTSGTEGPPKGVALSHANILANCHQLAARLTFGPADIAFNALPLFHSFGLTGGLILPLVCGVRTFLYPSPLHYRIIPELAYDTNATVLFGTDTFLAGYARVASPYDFYSVRYVFGGAEKVREETRRAWMDKFGLRILEGYGATETAPAIAANTPMHYRAGTVGRILPGMSWRLEPVPGIDKGGRLFVRGPNVMLGYLHHDRPGDIQPPEGGWYDTGDIVSIDDAGYVTILGRAKRFAKIAGEMVSLGAVEAEIGALWPDNHHAVVARADERRGEQLVLVTDRSDAARDALVARFRARGLSELMVPRTVLTVDRLPLLGSGKVDYGAAQKIAEGRG